MSKQSCKAFRLSFVRRKINTLCRSRALRAALLAELHGGPDAALVVQMVERASPIVRPPTQMVSPMPQQNEDEADPEVQTRPVDPPSQVEAPPSDGHTAATAVEISDSDSELSD